MTEELKKRTWVYVQAPHEYGISGCSCGNQDTVWSEYEGHVWCATCEKDFIPEDSGVFDGPIGIETCRLMGIVFDRFNLETQEIEPFDYDALVKAHVSKRVKVEESHGTS